MRKYFAIFGLFICSLISVSQNYSLNWQKNMPMNATGLLVDTLGNCYVSAQGFKLEKYNTNGNLIWSRTNFGYTSGNINFDKSGNLLVTATKTSTSGNLNDFYIGKYDTAGTLLWTSTIDEAGLENNLTCLSVDYNNNIILFGYSRISVTDNNFLTVKLNSAGTVLWKKNFSFTPSTNELPKSVTCDSLNSVYVYGVSRYPSVFSDSLILVKYDLNGNFVKSKNITPSLTTSGQYQVNGPTNLFHFNKHIFVATSGYDALALGPPNTNLKLHRMDTALVKDTVIFQGPFVKYMGIITYPDKDFITIGGSADTYTYNGSNYVYVGFYDYSSKLKMTNYSSIGYNSMGPFYTSGAPCLSFKNGTFLNNVTSMSGTSTFKILNAAYSSVTTVTTIPIATSYVPNAIFGPALIDNSNNIFHLYSNTNATQFYLNKYSLITGIENGISSSILRFSVFPNPCSNEIFINKNATAINSLEILDISGRLLLKTEFTNSAIVGHLPKGMYLLKVYDKNSTISVHKFIKE